MSVIDLSDAINRRAARPRYDTGLQTYQSGKINIDIGHTHLEISNDALTQLNSEEKEIKSDEISLDRQGMEYFRRVLLEACERLRATAAGVIRKPADGERDAASYLRPIFMAKSGVDYWDALRKIRSLDVPVPRDYLIFLPGVDASHPSRDDLIRALVPFRKTQQQALMAGWKDETSAIRIRHDGVSKAFVLI